MIIGRSRCVWDFVFDNLHKQYILEVTIAEAGRGRCSNVVSHLSLLNLIFFSWSFLPSHVFVQIFFAKHKIVCLFLWGLSEGGDGCLVIFAFLCVLICHFCCFLVCTIYMFVFPYLGMFVFPNLCMLVFTNLCVEVEDGRIWEMDEPLFP